MIRRACFVFLIACLVSTGLSESVLYMVERSTDSLFTVDLNTGASSLIGPLGIDVVFTGLAYQPASDEFLVTNDGALNGPASELYRVSPLTGAATLVGSTGFQTISGLAYDPNNGILYGTSGESDSLYRIDTSTGAASLIGSFGFNANVGGLAFDSSTQTLYMNEIVTDSLYSLNTSNGAATLIGFNGQNANIIGLAYHPTTARCTA